MLRSPTRLVVLLALVTVAAWIALQPARSPRWKQIRPGVEFGMLSGEPLCRSGSSQVALLRLDPGRVRLRVLHYSREPERRPLDIVEWQRRTGALAVFNAGQYYPDFSYMGLLVSGGRVISKRLHPSYKAALVAGPEGGGFAARVLDLERHPLDPGNPGWDEVAQSFMLFDSSGSSRVRSSAQVAHRTAVGEDRRGRLLVATTEGGYTLLDFAQLLKNAPLQLTRAMSMDGGLEAELCVRSGRFRYASFGRWDERKEPDVPGAQVGLPAVIAVVAE